MTPDESVPTRPERTIARMVERAGAEIPQSLRDLRASDLIGLSVEAATTLIVAAGGRVEVFTESDKRATADLQLKRVRLRTINEIVVKAYGPALAPDEP